MLTMDENRIAVRIRKQADELLDDPEILRDLLLATAAALPLPKPKKPKTPATPKRAKPKAVKRRRVD